MVAAFFCWIKKLRKMRRQHDSGPVQQNDIGWNDQSAYPFAYPFTAGQIWGDSLEKLWCDVVGNCWGKG